MTFISKNWTSARKEKRQRDRRKIIRPWYGDPPYGDPGGWRPETPQEWVYEYKPKVSFFQMAMRIIVTFAVATFIISVVLMVVKAYARDNGQWSNSDPSLRQWFRSQRSPLNGSFCCSEADGTYAQEDMRDGHYWTQFTAFGQSSGWMQVPDEVVIHDPNRNGSPVVWFYFEQGSPKIRCYAPGGGA